MKKKSLSAKKTIHKKINFKKILKDEKIFKVYKVFSKNLDNLNHINKIAISVSGGPDSMALCFLVSCYVSNTNKPIKTLFYIIDHGLRKESATEAALVKKKLKSKNLNLKILRWKGKKPLSNLQSLARQKRYRLLFNECKNSKINTILTAHHQEDVYETFFSRLLRGSGTEGLSSFAEIKKTFNFKGKKITIFRPLLNCSKQDLVYISKKVFNFYVDDPSNKLEKFQRVRLRNLISNLRNQGLDFQKLKLTVNNLASTNRAINELVNTNVYKNVVFRNRQHLITPKFFLYPDEIVFRSLSSLIKKINKNYYPPRGKQIINLIRDLNKKDKMKATLGGTIIEKIHNSVVITKEKLKKS